MGFFDFDDSGRISISQMIWIYPAIVVPLTASVFVVWLAWIKLRPNKVADEVNKLGLTIQQRETAEMSGGNQALPEASEESGFRTKVKEVLLKWLHEMENLLTMSRGREETGDALELQ